MKLISLAMLCRKMDQDQICTFIHPLSQELLWAIHSTEKVTKGHSKWSESAFHWNAMGLKGKLHLLMNTFLCPHEFFPFILLSGELLCFFSKCTERTEVTKPHSFMRNHKYINISTSSFISFMFHFLIWIHPNIFYPGPCKSIGIFLSYGFLSASVLCSDKQRMDWPRGMHIT